MVTHDTGRPALFLDRDGVLNQRIMGGYVTSWEAFQWLPGVLEALHLLSHHFFPIIIVSNQQGVGKGLMTSQQLEALHSQMLQEIVAAGGRIDKIYTCTSLATAGDSRRKPNIGMYADAMKDFPSLSKQHKIMVGDTISDLLFGRAADMECVWIDHRTENIPTHLFNHRFSGLLEWITDWLKNQ